MAHNSFQMFEYIAIRLNKQARVHFDKLASLLPRFSDRWFPSTSLECVKKVVGV